MIRVSHKKTIIFLICLVILIIILPFALNLYVKCSVRDSIIGSDAASELKDVDCILVLGCRVHEDGTPSNMLSDRLMRGVELYDKGVSKKIIMSGDHGKADYNEVGAMKQYGIDAGIPSEDIFMDHAGFSTYESIYRAKEIFGCDKIVIVTQEYHLYRSLYIAKSLGIEAYGVASDYHTYYGQLRRDIREVFARNKDLFYCIFKPQPTYLGDRIQVSGSGDVTND